MSTNYRYDFDRDFRPKDWYKTSLSQILNQYAGNHKHDLGEIAYSILHDAAVAVYCHESRINLWIQGVDISRQPFHPDLGFVRSGYVEALSKIIPFFEALNRDTTQLYPNSVHLIGLSLLPLLQEKLKVLDLEYNDRVWYYSQFPSTNVS